jgi:hypothetical protein
VDYLAKQHQRPFQSYIPALAGVATSRIGKKADTFVAATDQVNPEDSAIWFYLQNHGQALLARQYDKFEPLAPDALKFTNMYHRTMGAEALRMFFYLLLICTRETRHIQNLSEIGPMMTKKYGSAKCKKFTQQLTTKGSSGAVSCFYTDAPHVPLGEYTSYMYDLFNEGQWGSSFGGDAWASVAKVLKDFVDGTITAEMMMDTAFTLAHNNGPIFNKGLVFNMYDHTGLIRILDVQRSGQIPQMVDDQESSHVSTAHRDYQQAMAQVLGTQFSGYVDWYAVERLGAVHSYASDMSAQVSKFGMPKDVEIQEKVAAAKKLQAEKGYYTIQPNLKAKVITRQEVHNG